MTELPNPPIDRDELGIAMWLAVFDRWFAGMERELRRDEIDASRRWASGRLVGW